MIKYSIFKYSQLLLILCNFLYLNAEISDDIKKAATTQVKIFIFN